MHEGSVFTLCTLKDGSVLSGGGKDGRIVTYDADLNPAGVETEIEHHFGEEETIFVSSFFPIIFSIGLIFIQ